MLAISVVSPKPKGDSFLSLPKMCLFTEGEAKELTPQDADTTSKGFKGLSVLMSLRLQCSAVQPPVWEA